MSHDGRTDGRTGQTDDQEYISVRLSLPHARFQEVIDNVFSDVEWCAYLHSAGGRHEHFHVAVAGASDGQFRKRLGRSQYGGGNKCYAVSGPYRTHGLSGFLFYGGHEGTLPIYSENSPWKEVPLPDKYYVKKGQVMLPMEKRKAKDLDSDWQLTYANFVPKCVNHARVNGLTGGLKEVLQHMLENSRWRPSFHMVKNGVPDYYYKDYEFRSGKRQKFDMDWMVPKF